MQSFISNAENATAASLTFNRVDCKGGTFIEWMLTTDKRNLTLRVRRCPLSVMEKIGRILRQTVAEIDAYKSLASASKNPLYEKWFDFSYMDLPPETSEMITKLVVDRVQEAING